MQKSLDFGTESEKNQKIHLPPLRKRFLDHTGTFYYDLRKEEHIIIDLALKMAMKGMSEEAIARCIGDRASYRTFKAAFMFKPHIIKLRLFHNCLYRNYPYRENLELKA